MPSQVWGRDPQEAYKNPYEYEVQSQFFMEANKLLNELNTLMQRYSMKFHREDKSLQKAVWMLQMDALDSLQDALDSLAIKKHKVAGKLFRDVVETLDLAAYFHSQDDVALKNLKKWYENEIVLHSAYRDFVKKTKGEEEQKKEKQKYTELSHFTHRTYTILLYGYGCGKDDLIYHDRKGKSDLLVLPHTISMYLAVLATLIVIFLDEVVKRDLLLEKEVRQIREKSLEVKTAPYSLLKEFDER